MHGNEKFSLFYHIFRECTDGKTVPVGGGAFDAPVIRAVQGAGPYKRFYMHSKPTDICIQMGSTSELFQIRKALLAECLSYLEQDTGVEPAFTAWET